MLNARAHGGRCVYCFSACSQQVTMTTGRHEADHGHDGRYEVGSRCKSID